VRITAGNRGPFTGDGTNSWLVGSRELALIDPGPDDPAHAEAVLIAARGRPITHILLTHAHCDHVDGVPRLKQLTGATVAGMARAAGDPRRGADSRENSRQSPSGGDFIDWDVPIDRRIDDGEIFTAGDTTFEAIHTPGHAPDHLCFAVAGSNVLFSGDHVMGWSTSVIAPPEGHMGHYLDSLERLMERAETRYLPGHGAQIDEGPRLARAYLLHRQMREQAVLDALKAGATTLPAIAERVYSGLDPAIWNAAVLSVQAHVELLSEKRLVSYSGPLTFERPLALSS
jgi:glyoxylase-like metal-dependent hydrolase (beta-lactamase superfamily II)